MVLSILQMVLPVAVSIALGWFCARRGIFGDTGVDTIKSVITNITLPVVLFQAFFTAEYNMSVVVVMLAVMVCCGIAIGLGYLLRPVAGKYSRFMPFLITSFECGMLGYALFGLLVGSDRLSTFAKVDLGQTIFVYTVYLALLKSTGGKKATAGELIKNMLTTPPFIGVLLGILLGATGVGALVLNSAAGGVVSSLMDFIAAPTACMILIVVGYQISFKKELMKPVIITALLRLLVMALLLAGVAFVIFRIIPMDRELLIALMVMFSLPAPFIVPLFADVGEDGEYISTTYSVSTLLTILCFIAIAAYSMA